MLDIRKIGSNVVVVKMEVPSVDWEQWVLLSGDRHHDNILTRQDIEKRHLEQVKERDALIIDVGDLFCAMQGRFDPRSSMDDIRPEDVGADYLDRIVKNAKKFYAPYAKNWLLMGKGNHESSVLNRNGVDLLSQLVYLLRVEDGADNLQLGGYGGWVRFQFTIHGNRRQSVNLKYFHGAGGGGPVTRGVIQTNRQAVYLPDANLVVNGHTHDQWVVPVARERLNIQGNIGRDIVYFVRTGTYKDEYNDGSRGFHVERWGPPKPLGAVWLRFYARNNSVFYELTQATE